MAIVKPTTQTLGFVKPEKLGVTMTDFSSSKK
jgi:hypothetical protein